MTTERAIPESRLGRMSLLGRLAGGIAGGAVSEGARQLVQGQRPSATDLVFGPANLGRIADRLSEMRGAAMKLGQLLSMDGGHLLPPQFGEVLARLRDDAHRMPLGQVAQVLNEAWGRGWESRFRRFSFTPLAAASIGQVHDAELRDGRRLAIKVQYPGIGRSIDSDVDNVAGLLRMFNLVPDEIDFGPLLEEAKRQLHAEADYNLEAAALDEFAGRVADDPRFQLPEVVESLTTTNVLAMTFLGGTPIESLMEKELPERNAAGSALLELALREVFQWGLVQSDPNFANYLYEPEGRRIQLVDFGATRSYTRSLLDDLRGLLKACLEDDSTSMTEYAREVGYLGSDASAEYCAFVVELLRTATEPLRSRDKYPFGRSDIAKRMGERLVTMRLHRRVGYLPPPDILFLHRKLSGLYLLFTHLGVDIPVRGLTESVIAETPTHDAASMNRSCVGRDRAHGHHDSGSTHPEIGSATAHP